MTFNYRRRVYLADTDAAGVVYFARGLEICHEAYEESLAAIGIELKQIIEQKIAIPIVRAEIDFLRPIFCGDKLQVSLDVSQINDSEFAIAYRIFSVDNLQRISAKANSIHVCIDPQIRQRTKLPPAILEWLSPIDRN